MEYNHKKHSPLWVFRSDFRKIESYICWANDDRLTLDIFYEGKHFKSNCRCDLQWQDLLKFGRACAEAFTFLNEGKDRTADLASSSGSPLLSVEASCSSSNLIKWVFECRTALNETLIAKIETDRPKLQEIAERISRSSALWSGAPS